MVLQSNGPISFSNIASEYGVNLASQISFSNLYKLFIFPWRA